MNEFWLSVTSGIVSALISSFIITGIIATLIYLYRKPSISVKLDIGTSLATRTLNFSLKNKGKMSLMPNEAQWFVYIDLDSFEIEKLSGITLIIADKGAFYELTGFNSVPCHPKSSTEFLSVVVKLKKEVRYDFISEIPFYFSIYTDKGLWKPPLFSKQRKEILIKQSDESVAYKIAEVTV